MVEIERAVTIAGVHVVTPAIHGDARGCFVETYRRNWFPEGREMVQGNRADRVGGCMALADRGARRHGDDDIGELAPGRLAHPQPAELDGRLERPDRVARRLMRLRGDAVHEDVDVPAHQASRRGQHEDRDK